MIRTLAAAAVAVAALAPAAGAASYCEGGIRIGTLCVRDPKDLTLDTACPILEGQTVVGLKCTPHETTRSGAATPDVRYTACVLVRDNTGINMACDG